MPGTSSRRRLAASLAVILGVSACASPATAPWTGDPVHLGSGDAVRQGATGLAVASPFGWAVEVRNESSSPAVVDGYKLVNSTPGLKIVAAAGIETGTTAPQGLLMSGLTPTVSATVESTLADRRLVGWSIDPSPAPGSAIRQSLVFVLEAPTPGDYSINSVVVAYHVANRQYRSQIPASFDVCVGATTSDSATCPPTR